jgi:hypothetical protein
MEKEFSGYTIGIRMKTGLTRINESGKAETIVKYNE